MAMLSARLPRIHFKEGRADLAALLYKELVKVKATLEDVVLELYRCYQQSGDLSSLIREDRHPQQALREAYYDPDDPEDDLEHYQPEPDTTALFLEIRRGLDIGVISSGP